MFIKEAKKKIISMHNHEFDNVVLKSAVWAHMWNWRAYIKIQTGWKKQQGMKLFDEILMSRTENVLCGFKENYLDKDERPKNYGYVNQFFSVQHPLCHLNTSYNIYI